MLPFACEYNVSVCVCLSVCMYGLCICVLLCVYIDVVFGVNLCMCALGYLVFTVYLCEFIVECERNTCLCFCAMVYPRAV